MCKPQRINTFRNSIQALGPQCSDSSCLCFELLGFDVLLDNKFRPWLLEVNHSPSFNCDCPVDVSVKNAVLEDALKSLSLSAATRKKYYDRERQALKDRLYNRTAK